MTRALTLAQKLSLEDDKTLFAIFGEIHSGVVPMNGNAHEYCRQFNLRVDRGDACINTTTYRHVYLPTLTKAVMFEISARRMDRYMRSLDPRAPEEPGMSREYIRDFIQGMARELGFYRRFVGALTDEDYEYLESLELQSEAELMERLEGF